MLILERLSTKCRERLTDSEAERISEGTAVFLFFWPGPGWEERSCELKGCRKWKCAASHSAVPEGSLLMRPVGKGELIRL